MLIYLSIDLLLIFFWLAFNYFNSRAKRGIIIFAVLSCLVLIFASSLRGNFTSDYDNYIKLYNQYQNVTLNEIVSRNLFTYPESGYLLFQFLTNKLTGNVLYIFFFSSVLIVISSFIQINKYTAGSLVAVLLFVEIGNYYLSFNLMRQVMAASIVILGSTFLYNKKFFRYLIIVLIGSLFHTSALIMIPAYFILNIKFKRKSLIFFLSLFLLLFIFLPQIINFVRSYYWSWYTDEVLVGYSWKNIVDKVLLGSIVIYLYFFKKGSYEIEKNKMTNVWINATFLMIGFSVLGLRIAMLQRFVCFFSLYSIMLYSNEINKLKNRQVVTWITVGFVILFGLVTKLSFPYKFFWS